MWFQWQVLGGIIAQLIKFKAEEVFGKHSVSTWNGKAGLTTVSLAKEILQTVGIGDVCQIMSSVFIFHLL